MSPFFEDPALYRSVLENLPIGIYVLDREQRVRFWNRGAEQITGYLAHEVTGNICGDSLPHCDPQGRILAGDHRPVTTTFRDGRAVQNRVFTLHKEGHRLGIQIRTLPLLDDTGVIVGVTVAFEEAPISSVPDFSGIPMYGCLDPVTGIPSQLLTRAMLSASLADLEQTHSTFGLLHITVLGVKELSVRCGTDSIAAFLRTSAQTIRHNLSANDFFGRWEGDEFLAIVHSSSPSKIAAMAELISQQVSEFRNYVVGRSFSSTGESNLCHCQPGRQGGIVTEPNDASACHRKRHNGGRGQHNQFRSFARINFYVCRHRHRRRVRLHCRWLSNGARQPQGADAARRAVIIGGAAAGTVMIANPLHILKEIARGMAGAFGSSRYGPKRYVDLLTMTFVLLNKARREGLVARRATSKNQTRALCFLSTRIS